MWQRKGHSMHHCGTEILQTASHFKLKETQLPLDVAQHCSVLVFSLQTFLWLKLHNFFNKIELLVTYFLRAGLNLEHKPPRTADSTIPLSMRVERAVEHLLQRCPNVNIFWWSLFDSLSPIFAVLTTDQKDVSVHARVCALAVVLLLAI